MKITEIKIRKLSEEGKMKAVVSMTLDNEFVVHDIKIIEGQGKTFVAMPSKRAADGTYKDIAHPINPEFRTMIEEAIMESYERALSEKEATPEA